jgi:ketosteroid isomerase-like protein
VEIVRRVYEAVARRDSETVFSFYDPQVEWDHTRGPARELMGGAKVYGHEGLRSWFQEWYEAWASIEATVEELIDAGEQVVSVLTYRGRGRASGSMSRCPWPASGRSGTAR